MIHILTEPGYRQSSWCDKIQSGLIRYAKYKRIKTCIESGEFVCNPTDAIIVIGTGSKWISSTVNTLKQTTDANIILISSSPQKLYVSNISTDLDHSMQNVISYLKQCGKQNTALYGVNVSSTNDNIKLRAFGKNNDVYYNNGDLEKCCTEFCENINFYDSVICVNDYAAISLINTLKQINTSTLEELFIISFANTHLSEKYNPSITSVALDYEEYGKAAIEAYQLLQKNPALSYININIKSNIIIRDTTRNIAYEQEKSSFLTEIKTDTDFYNDNAIHSFVITERVLSMCTEDDIKLLKMLVSGLSYEQASAESFISVNGVKYRLKRICEMVDMPHTRDLIYALKNTGII